MNIGLVTPYFTDSMTINSGLANHFETLANALCDLGNKVVIIHIRPIYDGEDPLPDKTVLDDSRTLITFKATIPRCLSKLIGKRWTFMDFALKLKCMLIAAKELPRINKDYGLDIIETSSYFSICYLYLFTPHRLPVVTRVSTTFLQMMDDYYPFRSRLYRLIGRLELMMIRKSDRLITHAKDHAEELQHIYNLNKVFTIIPHGISLPVLPPLIPMTTATIEILFIGRLEYRKGIDVLLNAIPLVVEKCPTAMFKIIGHDPGNSYRRHFEETTGPETGGKVTFCGALPAEAVKDAYACCDIFVAPSRYESFGLIYIEAMSYGRPVIGCKVGGVPEIIEENVNGLFAVAGDAKSLAEKIITLCADRELTQKMGTKARQTVEQKFTDKMLARNSLKYYNYCLTTLMQHDPQFE